MTKKKQGVERWIEKIALFFGLLPDKFMKMIREIAKEEEKI